MIRLLMTLAVAAASLPVAADQAARDAALENGAGYRLALPFEDFAPPAGATPPATKIEGRLRMDMTALSGGFQKVRDLYGAAEDPALAVRSLPDIDIALVQSGKDIVPVHQGLTATTHPYFDLIFTPGTVWQEEDDRRFISLPFALMEKNANCMHNGALLFALDATGKASDVVAQVGSETCTYFQFNLWAAFKAEWLTGPQDGALNAAAAHEALMAARLPLQPVAELPEGLEAAALAQGNTVAPADMTAYGLVHDGVHYMSNCETRLGLYPHCAALVLPSYSLAKSLAGGLGLMALAREVPGTADRTVASLIPACEGWGDVTLSHLLNMTTGRYKSRIAHADEASDGYAPFFTARTGADKTAFSCDYFGKETKPGKHWVYHTSDTYLLGVAMNAVLAEGTPGADYYQNHLLPVWQEMGLSPLLSVMRRTAGPEAAPFTGYGMAFTPDDIARIASYLTSGTTPFEGPMLHAALQRNPHDRGLEAGGKTLRYKNGFWAWNARDALGCKADTWLPFLSGFGGISVVLLPGGDVYYYFSDGGVHAFASAITAISAVTPICGEMP